MMIKIESVENGWAVERRIELEDDQKLVRALLRAVKRHREAADGETFPVTGRAAEPLEEGLSGDADGPHYDPAPALPEHELLQGPGAPLIRRGDAALSSPAGEGSAAPAQEGASGYKGFLLIACRDCGKVTAYNSRFETRAFTCRECASVTPLEGLAEAAMKCGACGAEWHYKTNCTGAEVYCRCVGCGAELRARWHKKLRKYVPV